MYKVILQDGDRVIEKPTMKEAFKYAVSNRAMRITNGSYIYKTKIYHDFTLVCTFPALHEIPGNLDEEYFEPIFSNWRDTGKAVIPIRVLNSLGRHGFTTKAELVKLVKLANNDYHFNPCQTFRMSVRTWTDTKKAARFIVSQPIISR